MTNYADAGWGRPTERQTFTQVIVVEITIEDFTQPDWYEVSRHVGIENPGALPPIERVEVLDHMESEEWDHIAGAF